MKKNKLIIVGSGQVAEIVLYISNYSEEISIEGVIIEDKKKLERLENLDKKVNFFAEDKDKETILKRGIKNCVIAIGDMSKRRSVYMQYKEAGFSFPNIIHPKAIISKEVKLGEGNIIASGVNLYHNPEIGNCNIIGPNVGIAHHTAVKNYCNIALGANIGSRISIEDEVFVGIGATITPKRFGISQQLTIGERSIIGASALVMQNVPGNSIVLGNKSKIIPHNFEFFKSQFFDD